MESTGNIYIDALRFGNQKMREKVTFEELHKQLTEKCGWKIEEDFGVYLRIWFHENFYSEQMNRDFVYAASQTKVHTLKYLKSFDQIPAVIKSDAYEMLQDYEKLQQAKIDAKRAQELARWAIWISVILGVLQIMVAVIGK